MKKKSFSRLFVPFLWLDESWVVTPHKAFSSRLCDIMCVTEEKVCETHWLIDCAHQTHIGCCWREFNNITTIDNLDKSFNLLFFEIHPVIYQSDFVTFLRLAFNFLFVVYGFFDAKMWGNFCIWISRQKVCFLCMMMMFSES